MTLPFKRDWMGKKWTLKQRWIGVNRNVAVSISFITWSVIRHQHVEFIQTNWSGWGCACKYLLSPGSLNAEIRKTFYSRGWWVQKKVGLAKKYDEYKKTEINTKQIMFINCFNFHLLKHFDKSSTCPERYFKFLPDIIFAFIEVASYPICLCLSQLTCKSCMNWEIRIFSRRENVNCILVLLNWEAKGLSCSVPSLAFLS